MNHLLLWQRQGPEAVLTRGVRTEVCVGLRRPLEGGGRGPHGVAHVGQRTGGLDRGVVGPAAGDGDHTALRVHSGRLDRHGDVQVTAGAHCHQGNDTTRSW